MERLGLQFSDGSFSIAPEKDTVQSLLVQREGDDRHETNPAHMTKVVRLRVEVVEVIFDPATAQPVARSEVDLLRAENAELRARLGKAPTAA